MDPQNKIAVIIHVKLFAVLRERAGISEFDLDVPDGATVRDASAVIAVKFPAIAVALSHVAYALNREYTSIDGTLSDNDEFALIPPVSGGIE